MKAETILYAAAGLATGMYLAKKKEGASIGSISDASIGAYYKNYHLLKVTYIGPTNYLGSRVKITSERFKQSKTISYDYAFNNALDIAEDWLTKNGFEIVGHGEGKDCYYVISNTFEPLRGE